MGMLSASLLGTAVAVGLLNHCYAFSKLSNATIVIRRGGDPSLVPGVIANLFDRFGLAAPDEARAISSYLAANYGSD